MSRVASPWKAALPGFSLWRDFILFTLGGPREARKFPSLLCEFTVGLLNQKPGIN